MLSIKVNQSPLEPGLIENSVPIESSGLENITRLTESLDGEYRRKSIPSGRRKAP